MKRAYATITYLVTITEDDVGYCFTNEEFEARTDTHVNQLIENGMDFHAPNDIEIEFFEEEE